MKAAARASGEPPFDDRPSDVTGHDRHDPEAVAYGVLLWSQRAVIAWGVLFAVLATLVASEFLITPYYRAAAILRPAPPEDEANKLSGAANMLGAIGLGAGGELMGGLGPRNDAAQEYISILQSYAFTMTLLDRYKLQSAIVPGRAWWYPSAEYSRWRLYELMRKRFDCEYDRLTGNMTLHFMNRSAAQARDILELYIDSLRERLRGREMQSAAAARESLQDEARTTDDVLLQQKLYEVIVRQVERQKLAQVEADFAFIVIDPPAVGDRPFTPRVALDCGLAAALSLFLICFALIIRERGPL
jgi:hypothetical protein